MNKAIRFGNRHFYVGSHWGTDNNEVYLIPTVYFIRDVDHWNKPKLQVTLMFLKLNLTLILSQK